MVAAATGNVMLDALANELQARTLSATDKFTIGTNLFVHYLPEEVKFGAVLIDNAMPRTTVDGIPKYRRAQFRVVVRSSEYQAGNEYAWKLRTALEGLRKTRLSTIDIKWIEPLTDPVALPPSPNNKTKEFVVTFAIYFGIL